MKQAYWPTEAAVTTPTTERRRFARIHFDGDCMFYSDTVKAPLKINDISFKGVLAESEHLPELKVDDKGLLIIQLDAGETRIEMPVTVNHLTARCIAFQAGTMELESIAYLRRLVELNLGDPSLLERELENLVAQE